MTVLDRLRRAWWARPTLILALVAAGDVARWHGHTGWEACCNSLAVALLIEPGIARVRRWYARRTR